MEIPILVFIFIFVFSAFLTIYVSFLYPLTLMLIRKMKRRALHYDANTTDLPAVTLAIAIFNEQEVLKEKLDNLKMLSYPKNKITFLFGSDGSTDETNRILSSVKDEQVLLKSYPERRGKAAVLNDLIQEAEGEIIVFSDANTFYDPEAIQNLVWHFQNPAVGAVCGMLVLQSNRDKTGGRGEGTYWHYDNMVKKLESDISTTVSANGALYAIRKRLFKPLPMSKSVSDDIYIPLSILDQGFQMIYDSNAMAFEQVSNSVSGEFRRRSRIVARNLYSISEFAGLLHPRSGFISFALWSHKLLRWGIPIYMILLFLSSAVLSFFHKFFLLVLILQISFCIIAAIGFLLDRWKIRQGTFGYPYYFVAMNAAILLGVIRYFLGRQQFTWDPVR